MKKVRLVQQTAFWPFDIVVKIPENPPYNYREVKFKVEYLMKERAEAEFAPSAEEQLQQIVTEIKDFEDSENMCQWPIF